jgi:hypothetical protein
MNINNTDIIEATIYVVSTILIFALGRITGWLKGFKQGCDLWHKAFNELADSHKKQLEDIFNKYSFTREKII